ncbi:MAG: right-handed parallel beta-helix repeat-containing protein [Fimbriimonadaceae bacterium]|nr:right-handed parallel beta-helix repeat-containing protein [Fimbriimonadaceae bacterium]
MLTLALLSLATPPPQTVKLTPGLTITKSVTVAPATYAFPSTSEDGTTGAIRIKGDNITVDFAGVTLQGTKPTVEPDQRKGTAVFVEGRNVTIKNLRARGYKLGLVARNSPGIKVIDCDFSYNWKQHLLSTLEREDGADWMSFHRNEKDEWLRYGCGIYLRKCDGFEVKGCTIRGGQSGLYLMESNKGTVWNNDFSFLSAVGLSMYLSSDNRIMHNNIDWCVRGYSHGRWNRGQDSAGIIIYEQSMRNVFAYNSVTHGGDGFFLWAGQSTMDTGKGGCNDNILYGNDWSHAPTNGIEATFSRNKFVNNLVMECWHGIWGGFSWESLVQGNIFAYNAESIALEHGQENQFLNNIFYRDTTALAIWQNPSIDPNWGYGKARDCRSRDSMASGNLFSNIPNTVNSVRRTLNFQFSENMVVDCGKLLAPADEDRSTFRFENNVINGADMSGTDKLTWSSSIASKKLPNPLPPTMAGSGNVLQDYKDNYLNRFKTNWDPFATTIKPINVGVEPSGQGMIAEPQRGAKAPKADDMLKYRPAPIAGGKNPFIKQGTLRGRRYILVDQWGPYDFLSPILWPRGEVKERIQAFEVLGPKGAATVIEQKGLKIEGISTNSGSSWSAGNKTIPVPSLIRVAYNRDGGIDRSLLLEYKGEKVVDYRGIVTGKGKPFRFGYSEFFAPIEWDIKWFAWTAANDPRTKPDEFAKLIAGTPIKTLKTDKLDFADGAPGLPANNYATVAEGNFQIAPGTYVIDVTTDDGCRVWLDGKPLIEDAWKYQGPTPYSREVKLGGKHKLRVEHFEIDGYSMLRVGLRKK